MARFEMGQQKLEISPQNMPADKFCSLLLAKWKECLNYKGYLRLQEIEKLWTFSYLQFTQYPRTNFGSGPKEGYLLQCLNFEGSPDFS